MNLAVTAADLRIGQGYVRCGRCERVFNALMSLAEDLEPEEQSGLSAHGTASFPALEFPELEDEQQEEDEEQPVHAGEQAVEAPAAADELDVLDSAETGTVETIVLEGDTYLQTEEHLDEEEVRQRMRDFTAVAEPPPPPAAPAPLLDADAAVGNPPRTHWGWGLAAVLLALLLAGQLVHHYRQGLVANRWLEKPLQGLYAPFGVKLEPAWDLAAYDLRQLGGEALAADSGTIVLRASVQNRAPHAQPPPLIRVQLQDRYGNALSTTAVAPDDYLKGTTPARMAPDQRLDAELRLQDPNRQAVSFELDACLPAADGLHCAHDS